MSGSELSKLQFELKYGRHVKEMVVQSFAELMLERVNEKILAYAVSETLDEQTLVNLQAIGRSYVYDGSYKLTGDPS